MQKEIGSEFWDIPETSKENVLPNNIDWYISGRSALRGIIRDIKRKNKGGLLRAALPSYLCESMITPFELENVEYKFYDVFLEKHEIIKDFTNTRDCDITLDIDYFGFATKGVPLEPSIIIKDVTHSMFRKQKYCANYYFGSLRKWAGFLTGGFCVAEEKMAIVKDNIPEYSALRQRAMRVKQLYLNGAIKEKHYLNDFAKAESMLEDARIAGASKNDIQSAIKIDARKIINKRRENAQVLMNELKEMCIFNTLDASDVPLFVPIISKHRDELKRYLIERKIFCPNHWPRPCQVPIDESSTLYGNELSIICDQRYSIDDMNRIATTIKSFER